MRTIAASRDGAGKVMATTIEAADSFLLRVPALPRAFLDELREAFGDEERTRALLAARTDQIEEAVFLASASLYDGLFVRGEFGQTVNLSLMRYLFRMATRCTPFGTFAAVGVGSIGAEQLFTIASPANSRRVVRLDQAVIGTVQSLLFRDTSLQILRKCDLRLNESVWRAPDGWRYVESKKTPSWNHYELARIAASDAIDATYQLLHNGPLPFGEVAECLSQSLDVPIADMEQFLSSLVREQFLMAGPMVIVTAEDPLGSFIHNLQDIELISRDAAAVVSAHQEVSAMNNAEHPLSVKSLLRVHESFADSAVTPDRSRLVQVDLHLATGSEISLPRSFVDRVLTAIERARPVLSRQTYGMGDFAEKFERRYGSQRVPLLEAIDDDFGVGFGGSAKIRTPLIEGMPPTVAYERTAILGEFDTFVLDRFTRAARSGSSVLELQDKDVAALAVAKPLPSSAAILGSVYEAAGELRLDLSGVFGPPSGMLLGRFGVGNPTIAEKIGKFQNHDVGLDVVFAEIVHLPEGRVGNVVIRPVLSEYEIGYLGATSVAADKTIHPRDLEVDCIDGYVGLWIKGTTTRVVPRMSNAHNFDNMLNLPVYRFLASLARQGEPAVGWTWGQALILAPWKPEVTFDCLRLCRERWTLSSDELLHLKSAGVEGITQIREARRMPHAVRIIEGDNFLELDLRQRLDRTLFVDACKRRPVVEIERAPDPYALVRDREGNRYANEVAIPFRSLAPTFPFSAKRRTAFGEARPHAMPGGEWIYLKIYCGTALADKWISGEFITIAAEAIKRAFDKAFFIRYYEHGYHLRVRLRAHSVASANTFRLWIEHSRFLHSGSISRYEYGTYQPEYERYGGERSLELCESIFTFDSMACAKALAEIERHADREGLRWRFALDSMASLAVACSNGDPDAALVIMEGLRDGYLAEFKQTLPDLDKLARRFRGEAWGILSRDRPYPWTALVDDRNRAIMAAAAQSGAWESGKASAPVLMGLLHMCANRIFPSNARLHELVILHVVIRTMKSIAAKAKSASALTERQPTGSAVGNAVHAIR